jgi:signal transduction histidine kinase
MMQEAITVAWDARTTFSRDHRIVLPDGAERVVHEQAEIVRDAAGKPAKWMGTVQDITDVRRAEELFRGVFENNPTAIQVLDENGFTLRVNAAHTRLFGAVLPADFSIFDDLSRRPALRKLVLRAKCGNVTRFPDMEYNVHDVGPELPNKPIWVRATVFPIDSAGGRQQRFVMMHQDITEARRMEGEILQIADWEKTRIGQDLHDTLGQQLAGLAYLIQALMPAWAKQPQAVTNKALAQLADEAGRSVNLVRQVARGLTPVAPTPNGLANALRDMAERVQQIHGMTCVLQADEEVTVTSRLAATHLLLIAQESVTNAVRHGRARHVAVGLKRRGERGELTIQDDGVGMPAGHPAGPGLGLRIMHYRAAQIGATLAVERVEGGGTRVVCGFRYLGDAET